MSLRLTSVGDLESLTMPETGTVTATMTELTDATIAEPGQRCCQR